MSRSRVRFPSRAPLHRQNPHSPHRTPVRVTPLALLAVPLCLFTVAKLLAAITVSDGIAGGGGDAVDDSTPSSANGESCGPLRFPP